MANQEFERSFGASPELFVPGREVMRSFSPDNKPGQEPDYDEMIRRGQRRLLEAIENETEEQVLFSGEELAKSKDRKKKPNPWEPFNLEPHPSQRFINLYGGPFSQQMELNRINAERLLDVAAIQGQVVLTDVPMDRNRSIAGVNTDGSVTRRRNLFFGEKLEEEGSEALVKSIPQGWKIEIPGQDIMEELSRQESKTPLDKRFTNRFNQIIRDSLREIMIREKLTSESDRTLRAKIILSHIPIIHMLLLNALFIAEGNIETITPYNSIFIPIIPATYAFARLATGHSLRQHKMDLYEYFMPFVEVDRVLRGIAFMKNKGRNLVRLRPEDKKD